MRKIAATVILCVATCLPLAIAQDKTIKEDKKPAEPAIVIVKSQLPRGWKSLGLTDKQKKEVLTTRAKYAARRQALEEQIRSLKVEEMSACEKLLTDAQRSQLKAKK